MCVMQLSTGVSEQPFWSAVSAHVGEEQWRIQAESDRGCKCCCQCDYKRSKTLCEAFHDVLRELDQ